MTLKKRVNDQALIWVTTNHFWGRDLRTRTVELALGGGNRVARRLPLGDSQPRRSIGPPAIAALLVFFLLFWREGSPTKID